MRNVSIVHRILGQCPTFLHKMKILLILAKHLRIIAMNPFPSVLFYVKTRLHIKYSVTDCSYASCEMSFLWGGIFDKRRALFCNIVWMGAIRWLQQLTKHCKHLCNIKLRLSYMCIPHFVIYRTPIYRTSLRRRLSKVLTYHYPFCVMEQNKKVI